VVLIFARIISFTMLLTSCSGVKVINPNDKNRGEAGTFTCSIVASNGKRVYANGKTEDEARNEALARCRDKTIISSCQTKNTKCVRN
jgi:hypothetical protein